MQESTTAAARPPRTQATGALLTETPEEIDFFAGRLAPIDLSAAGPLGCVDCGAPTPRTDLLFSERGRVCLDCHGEDEVSGVDLAPWQHAVPLLAMIAGLTTVTLGLPRVGQTVVSLGPTGAIAWVVMNLLPASVGVFLAIAALRLLRDAWANPLDEDLPRSAWLLRMVVGAVAALASLGSTLLLPVWALWPFL